MRIIKTLIINGSPRKNGDTITLIKEMIKYLDGKIEIVHTYYDDISPCIDCRFCWSNNGCAINDKMQEVYKLLDEVDNIVLASPIYFSELTGKLLSFASRLQCFYARRALRGDTTFKLKNKNGALIITGGGDGSPEPALNSANIIFRHMNVESIGMVSSLHTNNIPAKDDVLALNKVRQLAWELNEASK